MTDRELITDLRETFHDLVFYMDKVLTGRFSGRGKTCEAKIGSVNDAIGAIDAHLAATPEPAPPEVVREFWLAREKWGSQERMGIYQYSVSSNPPIWLEDFEKWDHDAATGWSEIQINDHFWAAIHPDFVLTPGQQIHVKVIRNADGSCYWQRVEEGGENHA